MEFLIKLYIKELENGEQSKIMITSPWKYEKNPLDVRNDKNDLLEFMENEI
jgi:hypothetical protein